MNRSSPSPFFILRGHKGNVSTLRFCYEKDTALNFQPTLLSGSEIGEIFIWNLQNFRTIHRLSYSEKKSILFLEYHKSKLLEYHKSKLLSQSIDGVISIWIYTNQEWTVKGKFISNFVGFCASVFWFMGDGAFISLFDEKKGLRIYDVDEEKHFKDINFKISGGMCWCVKVIQIKEKWIIIAGYENGDITLVDFESNSNIHSMNFHEEPVFCFDYDNQKEMRGISGSTDKLIKIWKINDNYELEDVHKVEVEVTGLNDIKISEDKKIVLVAGSDSSIKIYSWKSMKFLGSLLSHELSVQCLAYSLVPVDKKKNVFASGSKDKKIVLWKIY